MADTQNWWDSAPLAEAPPSAGGPVYGPAPKPAAPNIPTGYEPDPSRPGALRPQEGGPNDPAANDTLDEATATFYAQQVLAGAPMPSMGMGKVASQNRQIVMKKVATLAGADGLTGADLAKQIAHYQAGKKQVATLENQLGTRRTAEETALLNGQQFLDRSGELPLQTEYPALNSITQFFQKHTPIAGHDTKVAMDAAWNTFTNEYGKVVAGSPSGAGVLSDSARKEAQAVLQGNFSMSQKKAVFDQMKTDMENVLAATHKSINEGYDALVKQPGYDVPESLSGLTVQPGKQQVHILIPGVNDNGGDPGVLGSGGGGSNDGGPPPPGVSNLSDEQRHAYDAFLVANPKPTGDQINGFLSKLTGQKVTNGDAIAKAISQGRGINTTVENTTERQKVADTIALENKQGRAEDPVTTILKQGAMLSLSDEAAGVGNAAANVLTSPFTGKFDPVGAYQVGRDTERQRITDARNALGWAAAPVEFVGGMGSANIGNAAATLAQGVPALVRAGAKAGAVGGAIGGFGAGEGAQQSIAGGVAGAAIGAGVGAAAPYAVSRYANRNALASFAPDAADVARAAQAEGVDVVRPMVDPASRGKFGALESAPGSQNIIREGVDRTKGQIADRVAALGGDGTALETDAAGERIQGAARQFIQRSKGVADRLYNRARSLAGDARFVPQKAIDAVEAEVAQLRQNPETNAGEINFLEGVHTDLAKPGGKTVEELRSLRQSLRGRINEQNLTATQAERRAASVLDAAQQDVAANLPKGAADAYRRADTFYRERMVHVDDILSRFLGPKDGPVSGEQAFQRLKNMMAPGGDARRLAGLMRDLEPSERQDVSATIASTLGRKSADEPFTVENFIGQTNKMSPQARRTVFGQDGAQSIDNLRLLSQKLKEGVGDINRSRTANSMWRLMANKFVGSLTGLGTAGGMLEGGLTGGLEAGAAGALTGAAVQGVGMVRNVLSARAMVNPRLTAWLAKAADVSTPSQAQQAVKGLSLVISREPALVHELTPIRDFLDQRVTQLLAAEPNANNGNNEDN